VNRVFSRDTPVMRPEFELLLCCARTRLEAPIVNQIRTILLGKVDWEYLIQMARRHQTMPLLYRNLRDTCPEAVPEEPLQQLGAYFQFNARQNLARTAELLRLSGVFEAAAVAALPFKGRRFCRVGIRQPFASGIQRPRLPGTPARLPHGHGSAPR
jgi:hypothetical protein